MPVINIMIGLPRSGKTTFIENQKRKNDVIVSADRIRKLVYNERFYGPGESFVWGVREMMLRDLMEQELTIWIDETNTIIKRRKKIIKLANKFNYRVIGYAMTTNFRTCIERCKDISKKEYELMEPVINRMVEQWEGPNEEEGFDEILFV